MAALEVVRRRFAGRSSTTAIDILCASRVPPTVTVNTLVNGVADAACIPLDQLRHNDRLSDLFRVARDELPGISPQEWADSKLGAFVDIGVYDLMYLAETNTPRELWTLRWEALTVRPKSEEAWIDLMLEMRLDEFLRFFGSHAEWRASAGAAV